MTKLLKILSCFNVFIKYWQTENISLKSNDI